jgi:hypothetical protein
MLPVIQPEPVRCGFKKLGTKVGVPQPLNRPSDAQKCLARKAWIADPGQVCGGPAKSG